MSTPPPSPRSLPELEAALARDLAILNYPPAAWVPEKPGPDGRPLADALIVGAGMCGLAAAFHLRRNGIANLLLVDQASDGLEGPWLTFARMETLRSPKHLTGPADIPSLTFRAWYEAQKGIAAWEALGRIPRPMWAAYLAWYKRVTGAACENGVRLERLVAHGEHVSAHLVLADGRRQEAHARKIVLATGRDGQARPRVPAPLQSLGPPLVRHSSEAIDFGATRGKRVVVIGIAASAFDNAAMALEAGAAEVVLLGRAPALPRLNRAKQIVYPGFTHGFPELPDADRVALLARVMEGGIAPPRESVLRVTRHANARIQLGTEVLAATRVDRGVLLETSRGTIEADLVILGTGFGIDIGSAPELGGLAERILLWRDRIDDGALRQAAGDLLDFPYLDGAFRYQARAPSDAPALARIHAFTHASMVSLGNIANDIPAVAIGAERLARAIAVDLYREDRAIHDQRLADYALPELLGDEAPGVEAWSPPVTP